MIKYNVENLFDLWESVFYQFHMKVDSEELPLDKSNYDKYGDMAKLLVEKYPLQLDEDKINFVDWTQESFDLAKNFGYA